MALLTLVRHGQASYMSHDYDRLSPVGEAQARKLGEFWARHDLRFQRVFCGPAQRHLCTCEIAGHVVKAAGIDWPEAVILPGLDELDAGRVMHVLVPPLLERDARVRALHSAFKAAEDTPEAGRLLQSLFEEVALHWAEARIAVDELESWHDFRERVSSAIARIREATPKSSSTVVFTSAGPIAATVSMVFELPPAKSLDLIWTSRNSSYSEFLSTGSRFSLASYNSFPHLDDKTLLTYR